MDSYTTVTVLTILKRNTYFICPSKDVGGQESGDGRFGRRQVKFSGAPTLKLVYYVQTAVRQRPELPSPDIFAGNRTKMTKRSSDPFAARRETRSSRMIHRTTLVGGTAHSDSGPSKPLKSTKRGQASHD